MSIKAYIAELTKLHNDADDIVRAIVLKHKGRILRDIKLRIWNTGLDANLRLIGTYHPATIKAKKFEGKRSSFVTLRDTGAFMAGWYLEYRSLGDIFISSSDEKTPLIQDRYKTADIFGVTEQEARIFYDTTIEPEFNKILNSRKQVDLLADLK